MARIVKEEKYSARRNDIIAAARRLVYTKGYEQMTIQDILDDLQISKGAFYHYFDSKGAVLEALVEHMVVDEALPLIIPIVQDPGLSAVQKLERYFGVGMRWKTAQKAFMLELLRVWLADENAIVRQKMFSMSLEHVVPLLTDIVRQGLQEGVFTTAYPEQVCHVIYYILQGLSDTIIELLIASDTDLDPERIENTVTAYTCALSDAVERVLGAPGGSLNLVDPETLKQWFMPSGEAALVPSPSAGLRSTTEVHNA
ncbi:MAG: TetR/AcrR family transcriptional regulator [Anaerolineales bacterium]|nr:TetR/AcrR family transcriptional regulator [Anaerolineales bacterium]